LTEPGLAEGVHCSSANHREKEGQQVSDHRGRKTMESKQDGRNRE
jgi:hypothetical protein